MEEKKAEIAQLLLKAEELKKTKKQLTKANEQIEQLKNQSGDKEKKLKARIDELKGKKTELQQRYAILLSLLVAKWRFIFIIINKGERAEDRKRSYLAREESQGERVSKAS